MSHPEWLTAKFIEQALRVGNEDDSISVLSIDVKMATAKGDNYTSEMYRVFFEVTQKEAGKEVCKKSSIVVKVAHNTEQIHKELVEDAKLFDREISMMTRTLKDMELILKDTKLGGKCYFSQEKNPPVLVIEDLAPLGFRMADRLTRLNLHHCTLALQRLAKFHASSVFVCEKKPEYKSYYSTGIFSSDFPPGLIRYFVNGTNALAKVAESWPEMSKECSQKLKNLKDSAYFTACELTKLREDEFNVINHGDFWTNNMMFKYDDKGNVIDHIFVDFQISVYGTPAVDILYFLNTSVAEEVLIQHKNKLIEEYVNTLSTTMRKIGCSTRAPTLEYIKKILSEKEFIGYVIASTVLPTMMTEKSDAQNFEEIMKTDGAEFNAPAYKNDKYRKIMVRRINEWNARGLFDV